MISWRSIIVSVFSVLMLATMAVPALAGEESGTETIMGMDPFSISFENTGSDPMEVTWDITLTDGVPINIVLLDEENHEKFTSYLRYEAYKGHQYNYTNSSKRTVRVDEGKYYLAIESAHSSMDSSTVRYVVKWDEDASSTFWEPWCWPVLIILVLVFGVGILFLLWRMFGPGRAAVAPRPDVAPGLSPGGVAQLSPQPEPPDAPAPHELVRPTGEGATQLGPQPEPPDSPSPYELVRSTGEGATQLSPQPEPPDMPPAEAGEGSGHEPPAPGVTTYYGPEPTVTQLGPQPEPPDAPAPHEMVRPTGEGATQLSPQPEPPDAPAPHEMVRPTGEGATQLSPQPEPPDMPPDAYKPSVEGATELSPQPEPPDHPPGPRKPPDPGSG